MLKTEPSDCDMDVKIEIKEENLADWQNEEEFFHENTTMEMETDDALQNADLEMETKTEIQVEIPVADRIDHAESVTLRNDCEIQINPEIDEPTPVSKFTIEHANVVTPISKKSVQDPIEKFLQPETSTEAPSVHGDIKAGADVNSQAVKPLSKMAKELLSFIISEWSDDSEDKGSDVENMQQAVKRTGNSRALRKNSKNDVPVGSASTSVWKKVNDVDPGPPKRIPIYNVAQGTALPPHFGSETNPSEYFSLFFDRELISLIQEETALYGDMKKMKYAPLRARSYLQNWSHPTTADIKALLGVILNMGLHPLPNISEYFSNSWTNVMPFFSDVFGKKEFLLLCNNLHFNHSRTRRPKPKLFLIQPILEHVKRKSHLYYNPSYTIGINESTIKFPMNTRTFAIKMFVLSDRANGYIYNFKPFTGNLQSSGSNSSVLTTTSIVKELCSSLVKDKSNPPAGYHIYTDIYCTSPQLAKKLLAMNFTMTGAVLLSRLNMPPQVKITMQKMKKGDMLSLRRANLLALAWKDKQTDLLLSTHHSGSKRDMSHSPTHVPRTPVVLKPNVILDYNKHMSNVDHSDHLISSYQFLRTTRKWSLKLFFWCLEVSVINSYILYCMVQQQNSKNPISQKKFRQALVQSLVEERMIQKREVLLPRSHGTPFCVPPEQRLDGNQHFMQRVARRGGRCCVCTAKNIKKETVYYCETCSKKPYLHPDTCFKAYHTKKR